MAHIRNVKLEHIWYVVGLIATDGNLSPKKRLINITSKDREHLIKVQSCLGLHGTISRKASGSTLEKIYSVLQFTDRNFYSFLLDVGLMPRKSLILRSMQIPPLYFGDFLRGVIDGDGCIRDWVHPTNAHIQWSLTVSSAAPVFIDWLQFTTEDHFSVKGRLHRREGYGNHNPIYTLKFGKLAAKAIFKRIYYPDALALHRKEVIAMRCLQDESRMINYGGVLGPGDEIGSH